MRENRIFFYLALLLDAVSLILLWTLKNPVFVTVLIAGQVFLLIFIFLRQKRINDALDGISNNEKTEYLLENELLTEKELELHMLESQINPHFLYNTLDSIRGAALQNNQDEIAKMTETLSRFFRYCISSRDHIVALSEELNNVENYYIIQKFRFGDKINLTIDTHGIPTDELFIPKIVIQPLVENAIVHGLEKVSRDGEIRIDVDRTETELHIFVSDNGNGMTYEELKQLNQSLVSGEINFRSREHTGIALRTVNRRLKLYFGEKYGIHFQSVYREGTRVEMVLPVIDVFTREKYKVFQNNGK